MPRGIPAQVTTGGDGSSIAAASAATADAVATTARVEEMQQLLQPMQRVLDTHESAFALLMSRLDGITARLPLAPADAPAVTVVEDGGEVLNVEEAQPAVGHDEENDVVRRPARRSTVRPTIQGSDGRGPTPFIDSLAHGSAPAPSSAEEGDALGEGDEAHDLLDQLEAIGQPAEVSVAELFHAMPLPVPHDEYNPFERSRIFRSQSCHYVPKLGGDSLAQGSYDALLETTRLPGNITVRTGAWAHSYIYELRSIVPALSYLHDSTKRHPKSCLFQGYGGTRRRK